jgi:ornithine cyclodeaminase
MSVNSPVVVAAPDIRRAVRTEDLVEPMARAFVASSTGLADNGLIVMTPAQSRDKGDVYVKTATLDESPVFIVKASPWFAANAARGLPQGGFVAVLDSATGHTVAYLHDDHLLSDLRTAAAGSVVAQALAPARVETALVVGSGVQAFLQPQALHRVRPFSTLLIWARDSARAVVLAGRLAEELPGVAVQVVSDLEAAVRRSEVVVTTTAAREPLVHGRWLRPGQHITAIGADDETKSELDAEALRRARVFVDARATAVATGEVHRAIGQGLYAEADIAGEIGEVLTGSVLGRTSDGDITVATLAGLGAQDLLAAQVVLQLLGIPARRDQEERR